jgi:putative spermidine/putrescine transport system permease protein
VGVETKRATPTTFPVREKRIRVLWLILPTLLVLGILFLGGFFFGVLQSFGLFSVVVDDSSGVSLDAYRAALASEKVRAGLVLTFRIAVLATVLSTIIALILAISISRTKRFQKLIISLTQFNIPIPHVVAATAILLTFSQSGIISRVSNAIGLTEGTSDFPIITNDPSGFGILLSFLWKEIPFMCILILGALRGPVTALDETAKTLGASYSYRLRKVIIPYIFPSILSGTIIVFAFTFGSFEVPFILGQPYPPMLSVATYEFYTDRDLVNRPIAMALATLTSLSIAFLVLIYMRVTRRETRKK